MDFGFAFASPHLLQNEDAAGCLQHSEVGYEMNFKTTSFFRMLLLL